MVQANAKLTVLFEPPFWVGIYERQSNEAYEVAKITFGAEPKDVEVYAYLLKHWHKLRFSPSIEGEGPAERPKNPKRLQREITKQLHEGTIGTKAQQAFKLSQEQGKLERARRSRQLDEAEKDHRFALRQAKRKAKHNGH